MSEKEREELSECQMVVSTKPMENENAPSDDEKDLREHLSGNSTSSTNSGISSPVCESVVQSEAAEKQSDEEKSGKTLVRPPLWWMCTFGRENLYQVLYGDGVVQKMIREL
jgi:hypothetical protein